MRRARVAWVLLALATPSVVCHLTHDAGPWLDDFEALTDHLAGAYANLDWVVARDNVDLAALAAETRAALTDAGTDRQSQAILARFLATFRDPHLRLHTSGPPVLGPLAAWWRDRNRGELDDTMDAATIVDRLGFRAGDHGFDIDFEDAPAWEPDDGEVFAAGIARADGHELGLIRIAYFGADRYPDLAERVIARRLEAGASGGRGEFFLAVEQELVDEFTALVGRLKGRGIEALVIDITGDGGGNDWQDAIARTVSARPLRAPRIAPTRHPHWVGGLERQLEHLERASHDGRVSGADQERLLAAKARAEEALALVRAAPDRRGAFAGRDVPPLVADVGLYATGPYDYLPPDALSGCDVRDDVFGAFRYRYREGVWSGPLFVLIDERTASASEQFAALLRDNEAAVLIGACTLGAGAGYTSGGVPFALPISGLAVSVPDLIRRRGDRGNELDGVEPDVALPGDADRDDPMTWLRPVLKRRSP